MATNNNDKTLNVPHLRFPEFTGEWEKVRLGDNCNIQMCKRIMAAQTNTENGVPFYKIGTIGGKADAYISKELFDEYKTKYSFPRKGEVMITCAGTVGKCIIYNGEDSYYQDSNIVWIDNPNEILSNDFLYHLLCKVNWSHLNSTTIVRIYNNDLRNLKLYYPRHNEQKKITHFLQLINERIATQNKIIEKLQSLIKGITILLTTKGEPNTTIAQCLECHSSTLQEREVSHSGLYKVFGANGLLGYTDMPQMNGDSILIIKDGSGVGTVSYAQGDFSIIGTLNYLTALSNYDVRYLYFVLSVFNFQSYKTGMAIPHIYFKDYGNAKIYCPPLSEQKRIANVLGKLESKLFLEQNILVSFNLQKQYLLHQMFI